MQSSQDTQRHLHKRSRAKSISISSAESEIYSIQITKRARKAFSRPQFLHYNDVNFSVKSSNSNNEFKSIPDEIES